MASEMKNEHVQEMGAEVLSSTLTDDKNEVGKQINIEKPGHGQDILEEVHIIEEPTIVDFKRLLELTNYSERGSSQLAELVNNWEYKQANAVKLLREELENLHRQQNDVVIQDVRVDINAEHDTVVDWKARAMKLEILLEASIQREQILLEKLQESIENLERQSAPVEELSQVLKRTDNFLHFVLQNAPVVIGHQDKELRYRFIYNHFPRVREEDIIGKTDTEIFTGGGIKELQDFKRDVFDKGLPAKREITFESELFGPKTFLTYVEPVFSKAGETIGINYVGMEVTDQIIKREKMAKLREEIAVQRAKETELNKIIDITEETMKLMKAKQMIATNAHEMKSHLSEVVNTAEILSTTTQLDMEQKQLVHVISSSGELVLQIINNIIVPDLSMVESVRVRYEVRAT